MSSKDTLKRSIEVSGGWFMTLLEDMKDSPLTQPTANGGNHPLWILGHLVHSESNLLDAFAQGKENRYAKWDSLFAMGTTSVADASIYPAMDELLIELGAIRADSLAYLDSLSEEDLQKKCHAPEELSSFVATVGDCFSAIAAHMSFHAGQIADCRRALGREPILGADPVSA